MNTGHRCINVDAAWVRRGARGQGAWKGVHYKNRAAGRRWITKKTIAPFCWPMCDLSARYYASLEEIPLAWCTFSICTMYHAPPQIR